jgi:hypothetical protein
MLMLAPPSVTECKYLVIEPMALKVSWQTGKEIEHHILQDKEVTMSYVVEPETHKVRVLTHIRYLNQSI